MSRHVERRIRWRSRAGSSRHRVTPNAMTLSSVGIGLLGAPFFLSRRRRSSWRARCSS